MVMKDNFDFDSCVELFVTTERGPLLICSFVLLLKKKNYCIIYFSFIIVAMVFCLPFLRYRQDDPARAYLSLCGWGVSPPMCDFQTAS